MEMAVMIASNILFLALICLGVLLDRRVSALASSTRESLRDRADEEEEILARLTALEQRMSAPAPGDGTESPEKEREAEKRFSQGVANILSYTQAIEKSEAQ